jgi:hypothetical protein
VSYERPFGPTVPARLAQGKHPFEKRVDDERTFVVHWLGGERTFARDRKGVGQVAVSVAVSDRDVAGRGRAWSPPRIPAHARPLGPVVVVERVVTVPPVRLPASTYRRRRAVAAGLAVVLVLSLWAAVGTLGGGPLAAPERPNSAAAAGSAAAALRPGATYVVQPGDTFWSIVQRLRPEADPRPLVDRLIALHGGTTVYVGERITVPAR